MQHQFEDVLSSTTMYDQTKSGNEIVTLIISSYIFFRWEHGETLFNEFIRNVVAKDPRGGTAR